MKLPVTPENPDASKLIPPAQPDGSGIGVNYADAYIKPLNLELADGRRLSCKRKGLRITLQLGDATGEAIMNRFQHGPDPKTILHRALESAAKMAGARFLVEEGIIYLETPNPNSQ